MSNPFRVSVFGLAAIVALLIASPVLAQSEVVKHDRFTETRTSVDKTLCDFPVTVQGTSNIDDALFFDDAGNLVRVLETVNRVEITFSANGKSLTAIGTGGVEYLFNPDGSITANTFGINLLMTIPRYGTIFLDAGRASYVFDPHLHELFHAGPAAYDLPAFCQALSA